MNEVTEFLNQSHIGGITNWKLVALACTVVLLYFFRSVILWICVKIKKAQSKFENKSFMYFFFEEKIEKPISWVVISSTAFIVVENLELSAGLSKSLVLFIKLLLTVNVFRICYMAAEAFGQSLYVWAAESENQIDDQLAPFASRTLKIVVIIIGILTGLQNFGVNVTALLAGLGIGGVALAFAAQDTVANVFGTITIILDRPFKLGDNIKVGDTEGIVAEVGFRSTRIRTPYNSIVSIPNSVVAKERIDNLSERQGWVRFRHVLGFTYEASTEQLKSFSENLRYQLLQDPSVDRSRIVVHFNGYGDSSLNVLVVFHYLIEPDAFETQKTNDALELIHKVAKENKLEFAFPTRTLQITQQPTTALKL